MQISDGHGPSSVASSPDLSSLSSLSSDSDAYNTASARIHFGPLRSPEKKFVPIADRRKTLQPNSLISLQRRSPRLSTPVPIPVPDSPTRNAGEMDASADGNDIVSVGYYSQSHSGTPEHDCFPQDDPSSVLATRISRAHDNPSPPPHGRDFGTISTHIEFDTLEPLTTPSIINGFINNKRVDHTPELGSALCTDEPALLALPLLSASSSELKSSASQQNLLSFETFSSPLSAGDIPAPNVSFVPRTSQPPSRSNRAYIDHFLPHFRSASLVPETTVTSNSPSIPSSPLPPLPPRTLLDSTEAEVVNHNGDPADSADEQYIENALISLEISSSSRSTSPFVPPSACEKGEETRRLQTTENPSTSPGVEHSSRSLLPVVLPPSPREEGKDQELPQTPIRRSSRSLSPYSSKSCDPLISTQDQSQTPPRQPRLAPPTNAQTQKRKRRGKERVISPADVPISDSHGGEDRSESATTEPSWRTKESVDIGSRGVIVEGLNVGSEREGKRREEAMNGMTERGSHAFSRELGSLSPHSTTLLTQLVPSTRPEPVFGEAETSKEPTTPQTPTYPFSVFPQRQDATFVIQRTPGPESPVRFTGPVRFALFNNPDRTPAQRIPIEQAVAQGQISPSKATYFNVRGGIGTTRNPVSDTPARRVPISETTPVKAQGSIHASPVKGTPKWKSGSVVLPKYLGAGKGRSGTTEPLEGRQKPWGAGNGSHVRPQFQTPRSGSSSKLPFPIVPIHDPPNSIPKETDSSPAPPDVDNLAEDHPSASAPNNVKSVLRQHSGRSRIPRIGIKPYAKSAMTDAMEVGKEVRKGEEKSTLGKPVGSGATVTSAYVSKLFRTVGSGNGSNSEDVAKILPSVNIGLNGAPKARAPHDTGVTANLKRKRPAETLSTVRQAHPVVVWQSGSGPNHSKQTPKVVAPLKASPVRKAKESLRHFVDRDPNVPTDKMVTQVSSNGTKDEANTTEMPVAKRSQVEDDPMSVEPINGNLTPPSSPMHDIPSPPSPVRKEKGLNSQTSTNDSVSFGKVRRATRLRKPAHPSSAADVSGTANLKPLQPRRKVTHSSAQTVAFLGMSAVALKALTSSNTTRNQKYLAATLETEIIRKEGSRPESPTVKVRTLLQRQKEEKGKQRMERAARRARRSEDGSGMSDTDGQSDPVDSSLADLDLFWSDDGEDTQEVHHRKHRRGPGDEDDYESPESPERPAKRLKLEDDYCEENERAEKRRVKWDRGLSTTIYFDEVQPGTRARPKENPNAKGCLAKTAKALRLDTLGNLPNADTPLADLVQESVIVKKFVYDNDAEPHTEEVYVVRSTRSRSKKTKA